MAAAAPLMSCCLFQGLKHCFGETVRNCLCTMMMSNVRIISNLYVSLVWEGKHKSDRDKVSV